MRGQAVQKLWLKSCDNSGALAWLCDLMTIVTLKLGNRSETHP